jgi:hypothetical protein
MRLRKGLARIGELLNIRVERRDPGRLSPWRVEPLGLRAAEFLPWDEVAEIVAFKRDLGDRDQICLGWRRAGSESYLVLEEDNPSWSPVLAAAERQFQLPAQWLEAVAEPPFECNWTTLWGEPPVLEQSG